MGVFSDKLVLQRIVGQPITTVNIHEAVENGKICLVSLSSKELEEDAVGILGATLVNLAHRAMQAQSSMKLSERRRVFIAIDEFQAIPCDYERLLSEDAKFGCSMMLATQNLERLNTQREGLLDIVLSNCEQLCAFSCSASDAELREKELHARVTANHIMSQPRLHCYTRLTIPGQPLQIASLTLAQPGSWQKSATSDRHEQDIRDAARSRFLSSSQVDKLLSDHATRYSDMHAYANKVQREAKKTKSAQVKRDEERKKADDFANSVQKTPAARHTQIVHTKSEDAKGTLPIPVTEEEKKKRTRNRKRSKRGGKTHSSTPIPLQNGRTGQQQRRIA